MAMSPESMPAPPPSPIGTGRRSSGVANDAVLTEFLHHSLRVPDLVLPDSIFPTQKLIQNPPTFDLRSLHTYSSSDHTVSELLESMKTFGCFQLLNHGVPTELIRSVAAGADAGVFRVSPEKKMRVLRSQERPYGFEECGHGEEDELCEEFVWSRDEGLKMEMQAIWALGYQNFSEKMDTLTQLTEKVGKKILQIFPENHQRNRRLTEAVEKTIGPMSCVYKHRQRDDDDERWESSLRHEVMKMLIRGTDMSHALCFHLCNGFSEFHVYSKRGWVYFKVDEEAIVVTIGDQIQAWSGGQYKQVMGRPIYRADREDGISMAILYSPISSDGPQPTNEKIITLAHQAQFALFFTLFFNFLFFIFQMA